MSRIGKQPVLIPDKVKVDIKNTTVLVEGPKGKVSKTFAPVVTFAVADKKLTVSPVDETTFSRAMYGTARSIIASMVKGVTLLVTPRTSKSRASASRPIWKGKVLDLALGYSHPIAMDVPEGTSKSRSSRRHEGEGRRM